MPAWLRKQCQAGSPLCLHGPAVEDKQGAIMSLSKMDVLDFLKNFSDQSRINIVPEDIALTPECQGIRIFEHPLVGVSSARDEIYETYKDPDIVGADYMLPAQWLKGAKTVLSFFSPFSRHIKKSNAWGNLPSDQWLHGRIEGQAYMVAAAQALAMRIRSEGMRALVPLEDKRFKVFTEPKFYSNWSERHAAYAGGLGTFSLNRAIITEKGIAGRFCSVITDVELPADVRGYTGIYDNCSMCGTCLRACPVDAINKHGKAHMPCKIFLDGIKAQHPPWYGCGKCQCGMPCESWFPPKNPKADYTAIKNTDNKN